MSTQYIHHSGIRYAYDDSMHRPLSSDDDRYFRKGDWVGRTAPGEGGFFEPIFEYEIGSPIPHDAIVIRQIDAKPAHSLTRATALFWIAMGFLLWAVVAQAIDWAMDFDMP